MLIKNITGIDTEDEDINVSGEETLLEIAMKLVRTEKCDVTNREQKCTPILAAYAIKRMRSVGGIHIDDLIRTTILEMRDPAMTWAKEVMEKPACISETQEIKKAINLLLDNGVMTLAVMDGEV